MPTHPCVCIDSSPCSCAVSSNTASLSSPKRLNREDSEQRCCPETMELVSSERVGSAMILFLCTSTISAPKCTPKTGHFLTIRLFKTHPTFSAHGLWHSPVYVCIHFGSFLCFFMFGFTPLLCGVWDGESLYIIYGRWCLLKKKGGRKQRSEWFGTATQ